MDSSGSGIRSAIVDSLLRRLRHFQVESGQPGTHDDSTESLERSGDRDVSVRLEEERIAGRSGLCSNGTCRSIWPPESPDSPRPRSLRGNAPPKQSITPLPLPLRRLRLDPVDLPAPSQGGNRHPVPERNPCRSRGGNTFAQTDDTSKVQRIRRTQRHDRTVRRGAPYPAKCLHRLGQRVLLAGEARDEPAPANLSACFEAPELAQEIPPRNGDRLARKQRLEHHAVAAQQGAGHRLDAVLTDIPRICRTPRHARPTAGFRNGTQTAGGNAGERPQSREPVRAHPSLRDQFAQGGGRIQPVGAGFGENVVEERRSAGFEVREDASGAGGERRGRDVSTLGHDDFARA